MVQNKEQQNYKNLALLKNRLQLPLVVRQLLKSGEKMEDDTKYAMHTLLSDLNPSDALLCTAMCLKEIADFEGMDFSGYNFLHTECNRILKRYAHAHIFLKDDEALWDERFSCVLADLVADLENFCEIVDLCRMSFEILGPNTAEILDVLAIQIENQTLIADELSRLHGIQAGENNKNIKFDFNPGTKPSGDNVIPFRRSA